MYKVYIICLTMTIFGAFGGLFFKRASSSAKNILYILLNHYFYIGVFFYVMGALLNIVALRYLPYTIVMPISSITYIWTIIISNIILKEEIGLRKIIGVCFIIFGAFYLTKL